MPSRILHQTDRDGDVTVSGAETSTHSFVVKVWLEETEEHAERAKWRGYITHVRSGHRRYVESLEGIASFIALYLETMGVKLGFCEQVKRKFRRWKDPPRKGG